MPRWPRVPKQGRVFSDWFYSPDQKKRLRSVRVGRGVLAYVDWTGRVLNTWYNPRHMKRDREQLAQAQPQPPYKGKHRKGRNDDLPRDSRRRHDRDELTS